MVRDGGYQATPKQSVYCQDCKHHPINIKRSWWSKITDWGYTTNPWLAMCRPGVEEDGEIHTPELPTSFIPVKKSPVKVKSEFWCVIQNAGNDCWYFERKNDE